MCWQKAFFTSGRNAVFRKSPYSHVPGAPEANVASTERYSIIYVTLRIDFGHFSIFFFFLSYKNLGFPGLFLKISIKKKIITIGNTVKIHTQKMARSLLSPLFFYESRLWHKTNFKNLFWGPRSTEWVY